MIYWDAVTTRAWAQQRPTQARVVQTPGVTRYASNPSIVMVKKPMDATGSRGLVSRAVNHDSPALFNLRFSTVVRRHLAQGSATDET